MISGDFTRYQLNAVQFDNLFSEQVDIKTLDALSKSAADGNLDCIDMLHNLALRHDHIGERAENILFDLFSGKISGKQGVDEDIQRASADLYQTACDAKEKNNQDMAKLHSPSKLLYMAGSAISNMVQKQEVSSVFQRGNRSQSSYEQLHDVDLWNKSRMLMTDEISAAMHNTVHNPDRLSINYPFGLIEPQSKTNMLSEQIFEKLEFDDFLAKPEFFPINTGDHWVLFSLYKDQSDHKTKCVVFNSFSKLNENTERSLTDSAKMAGVSGEDSIEFINGDMQDNVPNGCGIFVVTAMNLLSRTPDKNPTETLNAFVNEFKMLSAEEQALFNIQSRRQLYEHCIL